MKRRYSFKLMCPWESSEFSNFHLNISDPTMHFLRGVCLDVESSGVGDDLEEIVSKQEVP